MEVGGIDIPPRIRYNAKMDTEIAHYMADIILDQIHKNCYSTGEVTASDSRCGLVWVIDASNQSGECWVVTASSRYEAAVELMLMLGWDLEG